MIKDITKINLNRYPWIPIRVAVTITLLLCMSNHSIAQKGSMIVRIAEIEIQPEHLTAYKAILKHEAQESVRLEEGVIAIFPMFQKQNSTKVRILEIYKDEKAYQNHLKTKHFLKYQNTSLEMVKSLKLVDMHVLDPKTMSKIFIKMADDQ